MDEISENAEDESSQNDSMFKSRSARVLIFYEWEDPSGVVKHDSEQTECDEEDIDLCGTVQESGEFAEQRVHDAGEFRCNRKGEGDASAEQEEIINPTSVEQSAMRFSAPNEVRNIPIDTINPSRIQSGNTNIACVRSRPGGC